MNTANLQLEGLLLAVSNLIEMLRRKGLVTQQEIEETLNEALGAARRDADGRNISPAQGAGMEFPIRFLLTATNLSDGPPQTFSEVAAMIGETRDQDK